jgi:SAM-dependent methyltransferase
MLELARTQEIMLRHLPPPPAVVLDVGGATGVYSTWLSSLGHETHLIDPVTRHVEEAQQNAAIESATLGDARALQRPDASVDVVLMLGPLYHLPSKEGRRSALAEAYRVLRSDGVLFVAAISRYASALDGLTRNLLDDEEFRRMMEHDLATGVHVNTTANPDYFTTAYLHLPEELAEEVTDAGLELLDVLGLEGPAWLYEDFDERWADPQHRDHILRIARALESAPGIVGVSAHLLAIGRKTQ